LKRRAPKLIIPRTKITTIDGSGTDVTFSKVKALRIELLSRRISSEPPNIIVKVEPVAVKPYPHKSTYCCKTRTLKSIRREIIFNQFAVSKDIEASIAALFTKQKLQLNSYFQSISQIKQCQIDSLHCSIESNALKTLAH
jgi:hypothetical protein